MGEQFLLSVVCFSIVLYILSTWWSAEPQCGKYTLISLMRWWFTTIVAVMARLVWPPRFAHKYCIPSVAFELAYHFFGSFFHLSVLFFCSTMNVMSLLFVFPTSWFFISAVLSHRSLLPLVILLLLSFFLLSEALLPLTILSLMSFLLLLLLFSSSMLRVHNGTSPSTLQSLSLPPPFSFQILISSRFVFIVVVFTHHACWKISVNLSELLPAASFTCTSVASLVSLCCRVDMTTRSLSFHPCVSVPSLDCSQSLR